MDGIPLLAAYSLELLDKPGRKTWLQMFLLITAMAGTSTSSFMILPLLGMVVFMAWIVANWRGVSSLGSWFRPALAHLGTYLYLISFGMLVTATDKAQNAILFNIDYPDDFSGYLKAFLSSGTWPATAVLSVAIWTIAVLVTKGRKRTFILSWAALSLLLLLNPLSAQLLLVLFRGIYFRLFYIVFHPLFAGVAAAAVLSIVGRRLAGSRRSLAVVATACVALAPVILSPSSILLNPRYSSGAWMPTDDYAPAQKIVNNTPEGLMLAPYPLSGAIRMLSSNYPQLEARSDILSFYLGLQGRAQDAKLRVETNDFLTGTASDFDAFTTILDRYPEVRSIVFSRAGLASVDSPSLDQFLTNHGFVHHQAVEKYVSYWR